MKAISSRLALNISVISHLIVQAGQDHDDLDLLLRHHLPHARDGGVQRVLGQNEAFPVVEA